MASGDTLLILRPGANEYPSSNFAAAGYSANYGIFLAFDDSVAEEVYFPGAMPENYAGGGLTLEFHYLMAGANTTDDAIWGAAFQRINDTADVSSSPTWTENTVTVTVPNAAETVDVATITFTDGADMDSVAAGDLFRMRVRRVAADAGDTAAGDSRLLAVIIKET